LSHVAFGKRDAVGCSAAEAFLTFRGSGRSLTEICVEDGKTHNQIDHILIDRRWHLSILDVRSFRGVDCNTEHYLVVANIRGRLTVSKQVAFNVERFNLRELSELEVRKEYQIEITNRFAALEKLSDGKDIKRAWESIHENIKTSAKRVLFCTN
jgi:hypothetical protein